MDYGFTLNVDKSFAETEEWAKERLASIGFGILSEIDVQATMKEKLDIDFKPYKILGACNPHLAIEALGVDGNIGLLMPCNVVITEGDNGGSASTRFFIGDVRSADPIPLPAIHLSIYFYLHICGEYLPFPALVKYVLVSVNFHWTCH